MASSLRVLTTFNLQARDGAPRFEDTGVSNTLLREVTLELTIKKSLSIKAAGNYRNRQKPRQLERR